MHRLEIKILYSLQYKCTGNVYLNNVSCSYVSNVSQSTISTVTVLFVPSNPSLVPESLVIVLLHCCFKAMRFRNSVCGNWIMDNEESGDVICAHICAKPQLFTPSNGSRTSLQEHSITSYWFPAEPTDNFLSFVLPPIRLKSNLFSLVNTQSPRTE